MKYFRALSVALMVLLAGCAHSPVQPVQGRDGTVGTPLRYSTKMATTECLEMDQALMFDTSANCASQPSISRVFGAERFERNGTSYLAANAGNEIQLWSLANPARPFGGERSFFNVGNVGDSDYDLLNFTFCDTCRYGAASYKRGTVVFDLGTGSRPSFRDHYLTTSANLVPGAFTFMYSGQQYLVAAGLGGSCQSDQSTLYRVHGVSSLTALECVTVPGKSVQIVGGEQLDDVLYLGDKSSRVFIFEVQPGPSLLYAGTPFLAYNIKDKAMDIDATKEPPILVRADASGMSVYSLADPLDPHLWATVPGDLNRAEVSESVAWVAKKGFKNSERTFDISNPSHPVELDSTFWGASEAHNWPGHACSEIQGAEFSDDGTSLYLMRYSRAQRVDLSGCGWQPPDPGLVFADGFESGDTSAWSSRR